MTFTIILEKLRDWFYEQRLSEEFIPDFCPMVNIGEFHPHSLHTTQCRNEDITRILNTLVDLQIIGGLENERHYEKIFKSLELLKDNIPKNITENSLVEFADKVTGSLKRLEKILKTGINLEDNFKEENPEVLEFILKQINILNKQVNNLERNSEEVSKILKTVILKEVKSTILQTTKSSERNLVSEFAGLENIVKDLVFELKIDPNNPKPSEVRTEENSNQILRLNQEIVPVIERCEKTLAMAVKVLKKLENKLS